MRWLTTALKVHHIAMSAEDQEGHDVLDPEAEKIFKQYAHRTLVYRAHALRAQSRHVCVPSSITAHT